MLITDEHRADVRSAIATQQAMSLSANKTELNAARIVRDGLAWLIADTVALGGQVPEDTLARYVYSRDLVRQLVLAEASR
jgi:hypothetical protein